MTDARLARVVIVRGEFGGLCAAFALGHQPVQVIVVDRKNYHLFQPFLLWHEDWAPYAPGSKAVEEALEIRNRMLSAFEKAQ